MPKMNMWPLFSQTVVDFTRSSFILELDRTSFLFLFIMPSLFSSWYFDTKMSLFSPTLCDEFEN